MKSSLIIDSVDQNGVKKQKTITNINPEASNADAKEFARRFTALSTNEFTGASRVNKMDIDEPYQWGGGSTITIAGDTVTVTVAGETTTVPGEPVTVTVEAEPTTVTVEAEPVTVTVEAEPVTMTVQADPKTNPTFSLGEWAGSNNTYSAVVSYNGDGVLSANTGTLSGSTITVSDADGNFSGVISAGEGINFAPSNLAFTHTKQTVSSIYQDEVEEKMTPVLAVVTDSITDESSSIELDTVRFRLLQIPFEYDGDGELFCRVYNIGTYIVTAGFDTTTPDHFVVIIFSVYGGFEELEAISGTLYAREGANYAAAECSFEFTLPEEL